jgi:hypothetical protein
MKKDHDCGGANDLLGWAGPKYLEKASEIVLPIPVRAVTQLGCFR